MADGKYSTPMADFIARLKYHAAPGKILAGWHWDITAKGGLSIPTMSIRGIRDLPHLRLYLPHINESFRPARHTDGFLTFHLLVSTQRTKDVVEFLRGIEKVIDALQLTATDPPVPKALAGTVQHFDWKAEDHFILENSLNAQVSITAHPRVGEVGNRRPK